MQVQTLSIPVMYSMRVSFHPYAQCFFQSSILYKFHELGQGTKYHIYDSSSNHVLEYLVTMNNTFMHDFKNDFHNFWVCYEYAFLDSYEISMKYPIGAYFHIYIQHIMFP